MRCVASLILISVLAKIPDETDDILLSNLKFILSGLNHWQMNSLYEMNIFLPPRCFWKYNAKMHCVGKSSKDFGGPISTNRTNDFEDFSLFSKFQKFWTSRSCPRPYDSTFYAASVFSRKWRCVSLSYRSDNCGMQTWSHMLMCARFSATVEESNEDSLILLLLILLTVAGFISWAKIVPQNISSSA